MSDLAQHTPESLNQELARIFLFGGVREKEIPALMRRFWAMLDTPIIEWKRFAAISEPCPHLFAVLAERLDMKVGQLRDAIQRGAVTSADIQAAIDKAKGQ